MKFVLTANLVVAFIWGLIVYLTLPTAENPAPNWWIDLLILGGILMLELVFLFRMKVLYGFSLVLLYTLALLIGLKIMLSIDQLLTLSGIGLALLEILVVVYLIGVRGYLRSESGRKAMNFDDKQKVGLS
ncbi:MAG: hypothetical protein HWE27_15415 [Gammaproteobacteria bacterium]|nr:hypothetical protein [Gammaproteobacteria bacterium]